MINTSSVLKETRTAYPSRAPGFHPDFWCVRVAKLFSCLCCVWKAELIALLVHNSNTILILILILEYQGNLISHQGQYNDTTFEKQAIQVCA